VSRLVTSANIILFLGMSSVQMAISEIGVSFPDDTFGHESRFGVPFTVRVKDDTANNQ